MVNALKKQLKFRKDLFYLTVNVQSISLRMSGQRVFEEVGEIAVTIEKQ